MRRFTQFSIRALLILMLAVACWCGGWQAATWKAERDKQEALRLAKEEADKALAAARSAAQNQPAVALPLQFTLPPQPVPSLTVVVGPMSSDLDLRVLDTPATQQPPNESPSKKPKRALTQPQPSSR